MAQSVDIQHCKARCSLVSRVTPARCMVSVTQCAMFALACLEILVDYQLRSRGREFDVGRFAQPGQGRLDERRGIFAEIGWWLGGT